MTKSQYCLRMITPLVVLNFLPFITLFNDRWERTNANIRESIKEKETGSGYYKTNGLVFCVHAINDDLSLVSTYSEAQNPGRIIGMLIYALNNCPLILFAIGCCLWAVRSNVSRPLKSLTERLQDLADGERDLTQRLYVSSSDEFGRMGMNANLFIEKIEQTIIDVNAAVLKPEFPDNCNEE